MQTVLDAPMPTHGLSKPLYFRRQAAHKVDDLITFHAIDHARPTHHANAGKVLPQPAVHQGGRSRVDEVFPRLLTAVAAPYA